MYDYFCAFIVGVVEGLTEYIPVSSTGHMIIVGHMLGFEGTLADLFDVFIQLGAILSVLVVYREKFTFILNTHHWFRTKGPSLLNLAIAMFPACLLGLVFHGFIKNTLFGPMTVIIGLVLGGIFMIAAEKMHKHFSVTDVDHITWKQALKIGLFQCLSLWPGFSRSGSTIAGGLLVGLSRQAAASYTFLIAVPLMFVACLYDLIKSLKFLNTGDLTVLGIGFVVSFIVAYWSVLWFLKFLHKYDLTSVAWYRIALACVTYWYFYM